MHWIRRYAMTKSMPAVAAQPHAANSPNMLSEYLTVLDSALCSVDGAKRFVRRSRPGRCAADSRGRIPFGSGEYRLIAVVGLRSCDVVLEAAITRPLAA